MKASHLISTSILLTSLFCASSQAQDISKPVLVKPDQWSPKNLLVFGDNLSDSNGDDFHPPYTAPSTYNLLRTIRGDDNPQTGSPPLDLSHYFSRASTLQNIEATFNLYRTELREERKEQSFIRRLLTGVEDEVLDQLEVLTIAITQSLRFVDKQVDEGLLSILSNTRYLLKKIEYSL